MAGTAWFVVEMRGVVMFHWAAARMPASSARGDRCPGSEYVVCAGPFSDEEAARADCAGREAVQDVMEVVDEFFETGLSLEARGL